MLDDNDIVESKYIPYISDALKSVKLKFGRFYAIFFKYFSLFQWMPMQILRMPLDMTLNLLMFNLAKSKNVFFFIFCF